MPESTQEKRNYKATINLPQTSFPMKANLVQNEPATLKRWNAMGIYDLIRQTRDGAPIYAFHDGPPYANGAAHLGHLLNKVLKDFVVRSRTMAGFDCPYVPGWDCHGMPIEHQVVQDLGEKARTMEPLQIRRKCQASAEKFVKQQSGQMQRMLTLADYAHPYLTLEPAYEAATLEVFAALVAKGLVYRALKPVHWSIASRTALAEAELEYQDRQDTSVYVLFEVVTEGKEISDFGFRISDLKDGDPIFLMIWTTTPWTLPANLAVAVNEKYEYGLYPITYAGRAARVILATDLAPRVLPMGGAQPSAPLATWTGAELTSLRYRHPFIDRTSPVVVAPYVTLEDGTGLVHTAPGHGVEDYQTGLREQIQFTSDRRAVITRSDSAAADRADVYCPVREDGSFDDTAPDWLRTAGGGSGGSAGGASGGAGIDVWKANELVIDRLRQSGHLFHADTFTHSYPHDWRSKTPVIFRATEQWFVSVDMAIADGSFPSGMMAGYPFDGSLRQRAIAATDQVKFYPGWGRNRLRGMLESRPDWCISRQRAWGLPIPAFFVANNSGDCLLTVASVRAVIQVIAQHGSDAWYKATAAELLAGYNPAQDPDAPPWVRQAGFTFDQLRKSTDIFDVWFDSGTSWNSVIRRRFGDAWFPLDLYLEGSDQHRGWFQASLLPALAMMGKPPFKAVLTHGFTVDRNGEKISKSRAEQQKHIPTLDELFSEYGADIARWWVSSVNTDNDIKIDKEYFKLAGEEYRKVRNTLRYLLSNLYDFKPPAVLAYTFTSADDSSIDAWALSQLNELIEKVRHGYQEFEYRATREAIFNFCNETMSAIYLAATKDRMYCDKPDSSRRRRTQTAMFQITDALIRLIASVLPHTADEAWRFLHGDEAEPVSVHLALLPEPQALAVDPAWPNFITFRSVVLKAVEEARQRVGIENPLDMGARLTLPARDYQFAVRFSEIDLADLCGISRVEIAHGPESQGVDGTVTVEVMDLRSEPRCDRSWKRDGTVKRRSDGGMLSDRDAEAMGV